MTNKLNKLCNVAQASLVAPSEQRLTNWQELIELWSQALTQRELARKRMAEVEATFDHYANEIIRIIGRAEYDRFLEKYLNAIHRGCHYCYPNI
ncbi:hypothetical protein SCLCIDRAFT_1219062 [Scleroderma citrinum Foug A]|uniref:Uncharacterized protein n=1 Tax=Scleroderma citrinum Foug A TaxID=1036808 RepID=A0A0C2ZZE0_9AGAM|nr:hypothetical protein SCLCIDRAFT_1219062 [Scleroderma citrinum Foug A]